MDNLLDLKNLRSRLDFSQKLPFAIADFKRLKLTVLFVANFDF
ncbi:MAG: hypothetical protein AAGG02_08905 [Cyanobacteria bacterium P01_H01_bin.15]